MILQTMSQMKLAYLQGEYADKTAVILWDHELQGYILDIAKEGELAPIITAATARSPHMIKSFKSIDGAVAHLKAVGFTSCKIYDDRTVVSK